MRRVNYLSYIFQSYMTSYLSIFFASQQNHFFFKLLCQYPIFITVLSKEQYFVCLVGVEFINICFKKHAHSRLQLINVTKKTNCRNGIKFKKFGLGFEIASTTEHVCLKHFRILQACSQQTLLLGKLMRANNVKRYKFPKNKLVKSLLLTSHEFIYAITKPRKFQSY